MHALLPLAVSLLLAAPPPDEPSLSLERGRDRDAFTLDARLGAYAGGFDGMGVRRDSGGLGIVEGALDPRWHAGRWTVELPLRLAHRQTFGADLSETTGSLSFSPEYRFSRELRGGPEVGVSGAWRPGWPDLYQRQPGGYLPPTDRYGYVSWRAGAQLASRPIARHHLRVKYRYVTYRYAGEPAFDPDVNPMHLTPRDNDQHQVDLSWRYLGREGWDVGLYLDYAHRKDLDLLARNAGSGTTSFYTTPLQRLDRYEPAVKVALKRLGDRVELGLRYGFLIQDDTFQGYYSYTGHHPRLELDWAVTDRLGLEGRVEGWLIEYGANGTRPARLESGDRRHDRRVALRARARYALGAHLSAVAEGEWVKRETNYPDYQPDPVTDAGYDVRLDYENLRAVAGVEWRL